jgi:topoisomerase-4 subunit A
MHGNKGSVDGDSAAAMRYTEVRLAEITDLLLSDLGSNTVKFVPNFDDNEREPSLLPAKMPNLLMNGSIGIASGYSTNIPPHNLGELIDAIIYSIKNKKATIEDLMEIIKGPDFPTGGTIIGKEGIKSMYETGKGSFIIRGKHEIQKSNNLIKITEIPFEVNKSELIKQIDDVAINRNVGIKSAIDMTNKDGVHIEVKLSGATNPTIALENLFKYTDLQKSYSANMVAISNNKPIQFSIFRYLKDYIEYQRYIYTNKYNFSLSKYKTRIEIVEGLISAVNQIDQVIKIIRKSKNKQDAKQNLINKFKFTDNQAEAIVILRLYRLTNTDVHELEDESKEIKERIS